MSGDVRSLRFEAIVTKGCVRLQRASQVATYLCEEAVLSCGHVKCHLNTFADSFSSLVADGVLTPNDQVPANLTTEALPKLRERTFVRIAKKNWKEAQMLYSAVPI
jgi:hypothetical protein